MDQTERTARPRVLIIDPDVVFLGILGTHLRGAGYHTDTCSALSSGLQQLKQAEFDLILVEHDSTEAGALVVLPTLQSHGNHPCVLFMAQNPSTALVRNALRAGVFDFLIKPLDPGQIEPSVAAGLENRQTFLEVYNLSYDLQEANRQLQTANQQLSEQKQLLEAERDQLKEWARELNALNEFSSAICTTLDVNQLIAIITSELSKLISYDLCVLSIFEEPQVQMHFHATLPITHQVIEKVVDSFTTASPTLLGRQARREEVVYEIVGRLEFRTALHEVDFSPDTTEKTLASLVVARETIGLVSLYRFTPAAFNATQTRLLSTLANQAALALKNACAYRKTQELSMRDGLTGLYNHVAFQHFLQREFEAFARYNRPVSLIMIDIDHFKTVNDTYGHQTGDYILQELAALSLSCIRKADLLARYGGEEFALILPNTALSQVHVLAARLRQQVEQHPFTYRNTVLHITISLGVASTGYSEITSKEELIRRADTALYCAKARGRNQVCPAVGETDWERCRPPALAARSPMAMACRPGA